jgi:homoserine O-acetyltransferase
MLSVDSAYRDLEVALPAGLARFGPSVHLRITGGPGSPAVLALGGISGNRFVCRGNQGGPGWWPGLVAEGCAIDPRRYCVLGLDFAADPTGRSAPSTNDQAEVIATALDVAGIPRLHALVGASYGGMVGLSFASLYPERIEKLVAISAADRPHAAASATRELQRRVVALGLRTGEADEALAIARGMAMMTYRTAEEFDKRFEGGIDTDDPLSSCEAGYYLRARGKAFQTVMTPGRFLSLSASIDRHRVDPASIKTPTLLIGARSDQLVPPGQMEDLAGQLGGTSELHLLDCLVGHDMFLKEPVKIGEIIRPFLEEA